MILDIKYHIVQNLVYCFDKINVYFKDCYEFQCLKLVPNNEKDIGNKKYEEKCELTRYLTKWKNNSSDD